MDAVMREIDLLKSQFEDGMNKVGSELEGMGQTDLTGVLAAMEEQIKEKGGINIGDRWRLRFKDDCNKDLFLQDRAKKGYYRFRTTKCDRIVPGVKCNPRCCDGMNDQMK